VRARAGSRRPEISGGRYAPGKEGEGGRRALAGGDGGSEGERERRHARAGGQGELGRAWPMRRKGERGWAIGLGRVLGRVERRRKRGRGE
jgi:hypothetical protein